MSEQFRDYVTGTSFALTLSKRMIEMLCQMDQYGYAFGHTGTARSLADHGLAEWADKDAVVAGAAYPQFLKFRLTEAGKVVMPLLRLAGLYVQHPEIPPAADLPEPVVTIRAKEPQDE